jgi:NAD+ synthase
MPASDADDCRRHSLDRAAGTDRSDHAPASWAGPEPPTGPAPGRTPPTRTPSCRPGFDPELDKFSVEFALGTGERLPSFSLNVVGDGKSIHRRLGGRDFLTIMAATNEKQRVRMMLTYRWADEHNGQVIGTSNRLELDQGFFVKHGDGCGDVFPPRHLVKTHVFELASHLGVPEAVQQRTPTTDTFSAPQTQEEYFYGAATEMGDDLWLAYHNSEDPAAVAQRHGLTVADVEKFFSTYRRRAAYSDYLRGDGLGCGDLPPPSEECRSG